MNSVDVPSVIDTVFEEPEWTAKENSPDSIEREPKSVRNFYAS